MLESSGRSVSCRANLLESPLQELLLAYDGQPQLAMPAWQLNDCLLLRAAGAPTGRACAVSCAQGALCGSKPGAMALALFLCSMIGSLSQQTSHALRCSR